MIKFQYVKKSSAIFLSVILFACQSTDKKASPFMNEQYRPQIHFSPKAHWMNDPNGLIYNNGVYHMFFQHYPEATVWGPMHWGHATSTDLVHWEEQEIALYPDQLGYIFSGSAVMDHKNTSGLGSKENPPMVAIFTYHDAVAATAGKIEYQTQGIAYSLDEGTTWTKYANNPVLQNPGIIDFRDPKVMWYAPEEKWIMSLAVKDHIAFYSSKNLINWSMESEFGQTIGAHGGVWECPDLFPLTTPDGEEKWILLVSINPGGPRGGSATQYFIGSFDGTSFIPDNVQTRWLDHGADNYAGVTYSGIPDTDGRRIFHGWMSNWQYAQVVPTEKWRSAMTVPRRLSLFYDRNGKSHLQSKPIQELQTIEKVTKTLQATSTTIDANAFKVTFEMEELPLKLHFENTHGEFSTLEIDQNKMVFDRTQSGAVDFNEEFGTSHSTELSSIEPKTATLYVDTASFEIFINDGQIVSTEIVFPKEPYTAITITKGKLKGTVSPLHSIWK